MEKPVRLKHVKTTKCTSSTDSSGRTCIIHFQSTTVGQVGSLTETSFSKIKEVAKTRLQCVSPQDKLEDICNKIPDKLDEGKHGTHRRCYQLFTLTSRVRKRVSAAVENIDENLPSTSKRGRLSTNPSCTTILFPPNNCLFCNKETIKVKGKKQALVKCLTKCAEISIKDAANRKNDNELLLKVQDQDLVAKEAHYHNVCRRQYTRSVDRHQSHKGSESSEVQNSHLASFEHLCEYINAFIIEGKNIERLTMLRERYLAHLLEHFPSVHNTEYKAYKLKNKIMKHYGDKIKFWRPESSMTTSELVYSADVQGEAIEKAFELASSDERRLTESTMVLRRHIIDQSRQSTDIPWPPSADWLLSGQRSPPDILINFMAQLISSKVNKAISLKVKRYALSFSEDICYSVTNGAWVMPKHILLPMTIRHLTGNAELITMLNRYGHGQSYTKTLELETAMCNSVACSNSVLPPAISCANNAVIHLCWDNFDLNEETPSGSGTTHSTHGIVIQELVDQSSDGDMPNLIRNEKVPKTKDRSVKPKVIEIQPCFARPKTEPNLKISIRKPFFNFHDSALSIFAWILCRDIGRNNDVQIVPSWSGWISQTGEKKQIDDKSVVEYMAPLNVSINENSTVQHILEKSVNACQEAGQQYAIVTFDLAVAKKAYSLVWQYSDKFSQVVVRMGVFHTICSLFGTVGKMVKGSGFAEIVIEAGICASGSLEQVMSGKHYNRALRVHKLFVEGLERLLIDRFESTHSRPEKLSSVTDAFLKDIAYDSSNTNLKHFILDKNVRDFFDQYQRFKQSVRKGLFGKTAQFWLQYMDIIHMILTLIKATKENDLDLHIAALYDLCPMFFAFDHNNYARYIPVYLMTLLNLEITHPGATELLRNNGFSVSRSSVPNSRNPVDITIEQTINKHAKSQGGIIGFSRNYAAYYRWCTTRHCRAKYVEAVLQTTDMVSEETSVHKELQSAQIRESETGVCKVIKAINGFTNPFQIDENNDNLYCLSSGVPAKSDITKDLLNSTLIGRDDMERFIEERLVNKTVEFHSPIKRNKLKTFAAAGVTKSVTSSQNKISQIRAERNIFGQLVLLSVQHDIDLELTLSYPLSPVPWSLATADGMPVKTDKAKMMHYLESVIQPTNDPPVENVAYIYDGNAILQSITNIPDTFEDLAETVFNILPKAKRVDFITDTYLPASIKLFERKRRGTTPTLLLSGPKTKTPKDLKAFMANGDNKTQLLQLIFDQWQTEKYASRLEGRYVFYAIGDRCYCLTSKDGQKVECSPVPTLFSSHEEADTRMILHCLQIKNVEEDYTKIIVRSPDTDVMVLLIHYITDIQRCILFDTGVANKRRLLNIQDIVDNKGINFCKVLPAIHALTGCDTTSAFVRRGKISPLKAIEKNPQFIGLLEKLGIYRECSDELIDDIEKVVCLFYGKIEYSNVNKLRFDMFCKKNQGSGHVLNSLNGIDMSLLPPCRVSLEMHVRRVNYQAYVWLHAHENYPTLPNLQKSGWLSGDGGIEFIWTSGNIVPQELIDILCTNQGEFVDDEFEEEVELDNMVDIIFEDENDDGDL